MRSLGEFFGHIAQGVRTDPTKPAVSAPAPNLQSAESGPPGAERRLVRHTVEEAHQQTPQGVVTIRRTIIEEVETTPPPPAAAEPETGTDPEGRSPTG